MSRVLACPCEDVTVDDLERAIGQGHRDLESLKRFTGLGTGICQGKSCQALAAQCLARACDAGDPPLQPFTPRPPLVPTELALWASLPPGETNTELAGPGGELPAPGPPSRRPPLPARAQVVIIGGGVMGLGLAYQLALQGVTDVLVLEQGYLCAGASGRNGGGVRMQWGTPSHVELARRSLELMKGFARELGINIWLRQGGYLFLARSPEVARRLERSVQVQTRLGLRTELISPDAARGRVAGLTATGVQLAAFNPDDGVIFPWPFLWGYTRAARARGVRVETFTKVSGLTVSQGQVRAVRTDRGEVACEQVVVASGAWSGEVSRLAGVTLPSHPQRHEILSTEPLKPFVGPLVSVLDSGLYFSQSMRGELVGGMGDPDDPPGLRMGSSTRFLARFSHALLEQLPLLGAVRVLRQWAGCYDVTPDNNPILGRTPGLDNLLQLSGFVGHGFMMAPAVTERMAAWMAKGESDELFTRFSLERFARGELEREEMIIG